MDLDCRQINREVANYQASDYWPQNENNKLDTRPRSHDHLKNRLNNEERRIGCLSTFRTKPPHGRPGIAGSTYCLPFLTQKRRFRRRLHSRGILPEPSPYTPPAVLEALPGWRWSSLLTCLPTDAPLGHSAEFQHPPAPARWLLAFSLPTQETI